MSKKGLPENFRLRHDSHYVELLTSRGTGAPVGRMIPIDKLAPSHALKSETFPSWCYRSERRESSSLFLLDPATLAAGS